MATIRKASMPSRSVIMNICSMEAPLVLARVGNETDAGEAGFAGSSHDFGERLILSGLVGAQVQFRLRIQPGGRGETLRQFRALDALAVPEHFVRGVDR